MVRNRRILVFLALMLCTLVLVPAQAALSEASYDVYVPFSTKVSPGQQHDIEVLVYRTGPGDVTTVTVEAVVDGGLDVTPAQTEATFTPDGEARTTLTLAAPLDVTVPSEATLVVSVAGTPYSIDVQIDIASRLGTASASSTQPGFRPSGANNGNRDSSSWTAFGPWDNGWNDNTTGAFPDWLRIDFTGPVPIGRIDLYTLDSVTFPAALWGIRDADVELLVDGWWQRVIPIRDNLLFGKISQTFEPLTASAVRVTIRNSNDQPITGGGSRIIELEAYPS